MAEYKVGDAVTIRNTETGEVVNTTISYVSFYNPDSVFDTKAGYTVEHDHSPWEVVPRYTTGDLDNLGHYAFVAPPQDASSATYNPYFKGDDGLWYIVDSDDLVRSSAENILYDIINYGFRVVYTGLDVRTPVIVDEPTQYGAKVEVDGTFDNEGNRVVVYRLPDVVDPSSTNAQVWVEFGTDGIQSFSVWPWYLLLERNPKVVD